MLTPPEEKPKLTCAAAGVMPASARAIARTRERMGEYLRSVRLRPRPGSCLARGSGCFKSCHDERSVHGLVAVPAEDVAEEDERPGLVGSERQALGLSRHDVGA